MNTDEIDDDPKVVESAAKLELPYAMQCLCHWFARRRWDMWIQMQLMTPLRSLKVLPDWDCPMLRMCLCFAKRRWDTWITDEIDDTPEVDENATKLGLP